MSDNLTPEGDEPTYDELYERAQELDVDGRSSMDKDELQAAVEEAEAEQDVTTTGEVNTPSTGSGDRARTEDAVAPPTPLERAAPMDNTLANEANRAAEEDPNVRARVVNPSHEPDEDGFVGVDPEYTQRANQTERPRPVDEDADSEE